MHRKLPPLGRAKFAAITAVEGLKLSDAAKKRRAAAQAKKLTPEQARRHVVAAYQGRTGR